MSFWKRGSYVFVSLLFASLGCSRKESSDKPDQRKEFKKNNALGFRSPPVSGSAAADLFAPIPEPGNPVSLGYGIDLQNQKGFSNRCVEGKEEIIPKQEGYLSLDAEMNKSDVSIALGNETSGGVNLAKWGATARGKFELKMNENKFGLNYVVFTFNKHHSKVFVPTNRSDYFKAASQEEWKTSCGTGYVAAQDFGSMLLIKFSLQLEKSSQSSSFSSSGSGYLSFAKLKSSISANYSKNRAKGMLSVSAIQIGGKPEELGKILVTKGTDGGREGAGLIENFALCDVSEVEKCLAGLRSIERYLSQEFPAQIADKENGGGSVLNTYPFVYPKNIGGDFNPAGDQFLTLARKGLGELYESELNEGETIKRLGKSDDEGLTELANKMSENVRKIRETSAQCFDPSQYKQCTENFEKLKLDCAGTTIPEYLKERMTK